MNEQPAPTMLARAQHSISRKRISPGALRVMYTLHEAGFQAHLVGGAVRDLLLGGEPKDFDIATDARPEQIRQLFRNCRLIGRRFVIAHVRMGGEILEVTTFRGTGVGADPEDEVDREVDASEGLILRDNVFGTMEEDALRRDFTVNALYYAVADFAVRDYATGLADLEHRQLRLIGDPETRFREDPVRMLRAARLGAKLGFSIADSTERPIGRLAPLLDAIPPARLLDEFQKLFLYGAGEKSYDELVRLRLFEHLFPSIGIDMDSGRPYADRLIRAALASTDARVAAGKSVTPAFLIAAFLWEPYQHMVAHLPEEREEAFGDAAEEVFREAGERVALPRRFSQVAREIWELQPRFMTNSPGRARRLLRHPRFRAAYDFLELRAVIDPLLAPVAERWERAQTVAPEDIDPLFRQVVAPRHDPAGSTPEADGAQGKRRRRRRRRRPDGAPAPVPAE
jgi:poly(A) polymerase